MIIITILLQKMQCDIAGRVLQKHQIAPTHSNNITIHIHTMNPTNASHFQLMLAKMAWSRAFGLSRIRCRGIIEAINNNFRSPNFFRATLLNKCSLCMKRAVKIRLVLCIAHLIYAIFNHPAALNHECYDLVLLIILVLRGNRLSDLLQKRDSSYASLLRW